MEEESNIQSPNSTQELKTAWLIISTIIVTTLIVGGIAFWWFNSCQKQSQVAIKNLQDTLASARENNKQLQGQIVNLQDQLNKVSDENKKDINLLIEKLCKNKASLGLSDYGDGEIYQCGDYIGVYPPNYLLDAPIFIFDSNGNKVTYCGGMPQPTPRETPKECEIECKRTQLKLCSDR